MTTRSRKINQKKKKLKIINYIDNLQTLGKKIIETVAKPRYKGCKHKRIVRPWRERKRERKREKERERKKEREKERKGSY